MDEINTDNEMLFMSKEYEKKFYQLELLVAMKNYLEKPNEINSESNQVLISRTINIFGLQNGTTLSEINKLLRETEISIISIETAVFSTFVGEAWFESFHYIKGTYQHTSEEYRKLLEEIDTYQFADGEKIGFTVSRFLSRWKTVRILYDGDFFVGYFQNKIEKTPEMEKVFYVICEIGEHIVQLLQRTNHIEIVPVVAAHLTNLLPMQSTFPFVTNVKRERENDLVGTSNHSEINSDSNNENNQDPQSKKQKNEHVPPLKTNKVVGTLFH